ncbi:MAG: hypothetical protein ACRD3C_22635, partial [Vicinamibacterales bacterium]
TMDLEMRWLMVKAGPAEFLRLTRPFFQHIAGFEFSAEEMRWCFEIIRRRTPEVLPYRERRLALDEIEPPDRRPLDPDRDIETDVSHEKVRPQ